MLTHASVSDKNPGRPWVATSPCTSVGTDPIFAQIELHKALVLHVNTMPESEDHPAFQSACDREEAVLQTLGDMVPTTIAAAAAQLVYMADVEGAFADEGSPLLRTVLSVASGLASLQRSALA